MISCRGAGQGMVPGRSVKRHTCSGSGIGLDIQSIIIPSDGGSRELDAIREVQGWTFWGPRELFSAGVPLRIGAETFVKHAPSRRKPFSFEEEAVDDFGFHGQVAFLVRPGLCQLVEHYQPLHNVCSGYEPPPPPRRSRVGWAWTGGLHHRVSLQQIPLPGKVRFGWGSGTTAITSAAHRELRWV